MTERWWRRESLPEQMAPAKSVLETRSYFDDFALEARHATKAVEAKAMHVEEGAGGTAAVRIFENAPASVQKKLTLDWYTRLMPDGDRIEALQRKTKKVLGYAMSPVKHDKYKFLINAFKKRGVELRFTNKPTSAFEHVIPFVGRDHIKVGILDDGKVAYFGGVNFDNENSIDFMVKFQNEPARVIYDAYKDIERGAITSDAKRPLDTYSTLCIDAGVAGQSDILKEAVQMIGGAQHSIENTSLVYPDGNIDKALAKKAREGIRTEVIVSSVNPSRSLLGAGRIFNLVQRKNKLFSKLRRTGANIVTIPEFVHAKLLIVDRGTPNERAYFGTHNLSAAGVKAGTREWGIFTTDPKLIANLGAFFEKAKIGSRAKR